MPTQRPALLARLREPRVWDLVVIGGGATGLGVALDAAARGFSVALVESHDFAKGTSSRATKLLHGGVRYLAQGNIALVREALHERTTVMRNAPHLAQPLPFIMPSYRWWETPFYGAGLVAYDALAGRAGLGKTEFKGRTSVQRDCPNLQTAHLRGGVQYWDGQFNDARMAIAIGRTAAALGAALVNHCPALDLLHTAGRVSGVRVQDAEDAHAPPFDVRARCVVNATGVWVDALLSQDTQPAGPRHEPIVAPSQGVHLVVDRRFWPSEQALMVPKTTDGRVLFAVPWLGKTILGTTDTPRDDTQREPLPFQHEIDFILGESARYLQHAPTRADVRSAWVGLRPLVRPSQADASGATKTISREHTVLVSPSGLVTVTGGKWTTYRAMAEDVLQQVFDARLLPAAAPGRTEHLKLVGASDPSGHDASHQAVNLSQPEGLHLYGHDAPAVQALPGAARELAPGLSEAMVRFAVRHEYARTVEDVLARRSRLLFLDAARAAHVAPAVAEVVEQETGRSAELAEFLALARQYRLPA